MNDSTKSDDAVPEADMAFTANEVHEGASPSSVSILLKRLEGKIKAQRRELTQMKEVLRCKNLELDALHYVWCTGNCKGGQHRWIEGEVTEEMMRTANEQLRRLSSRYANQLFKTIPDDIKQLWWKSETYRTRGQFSEWLKEIKYENLIN